MAKAVAEFGDDLGFGGLDVDCGFFLVFGNPFAVAVVGAGGLEVEVQLVFAGDHVVHFLHVIGDLG